VCVIESLRSSRSVARSRSTRCTVAGVHDGVPGRVHHDVRATPDRALELRGTGVDGDHGWCAGELGDLHGAQTQAPDPDHGDRLTGSQPGHVGQGVERRDDRVRAHRGLLEGHTLGDGGEVLRRDGDVPGQTSLDVDPHDPAVHADLAGASRGSCHGSRRPPGPACAPETGCTVHPPADPQAPGRTIDG
jgi:hypothetical protein